jgi:hypothetical protein
MKTVDYRKAEAIIGDINSNGMDEDSLLGSRKIRLAFLDMLLYMSEQRHSLTIEDIQEEVDTFMFEVGTHSAVVVSLTKDSESM